MSGTITLRDVILGQRQTLPPVGPISPQGNDLTILKSASSTAATATQLATTGFIFHKLTIQLDPATPLKTRVYIGSRTFPNVVLSSGGTTATPLSTIAWTMEDVAPNNVWLFIVSSTTTQATVHWQGYGNHLSTEVWQ